MNLGNVVGIMQMAYQSTKQTQRASVNGSSFTDKLQEAKSANMSEVDAYTEHLRSKYGNVSIRSVGKDQASLERVGRGMSGSDVIIAPNILEQMATDPEKAAYYENKIDDYFNIFIPEDTAMFATKGLVYEPGGVVVHEDGTVTYIGGCSDSPERVAEVQAENKAKREAEAKRREESLERSREAAEERKLQLESQYRNHMMEQIPNGQVFDGTSAFYYLDSSQVVTPSYLEYEKAISSQSRRV